MLVSLTVGKVDAGVAVLLTQDKRLIEFPSILLPPSISSGSIVDITVSRNFNSEQQSQRAFLSLQDSIYEAFGEAQPSPPVLRCRNCTQTSVVLEWDPLDLATADILSLSLFRNGQKAGNIPRPTEMHTTKISGLAVDTKYTFHLVLKTTAGTYASEKLVVQTHKMTDLSGITVTPGILPAPLKESLTKAVERIGAKLAPEVRIDTTHFVTIEGRGILWEKAVEMNIPVVRPEWVEGCERSGRIVGVRQYYLDADPRQRSATLGPVSAQPPQPRPSEAPLPPLPAEDNHPRQANGDQNSTAGDTQEGAPEDSKDIEGSSDESETTNGEEDPESKQSQALEEQKVRLEDREEQKVVLPDSAIEKEPPKSPPPEVAQEPETVPEGHKTPEGSFQDVSL